MFSKEEERQYAVMIARTWIDNDFRQRLIDTPQAVLGEYGIALPSNAGVRVSESADTGALTMALDFPPKPQISAERIERLRQSDDEIESLLELGLEHCMRCGGGSYEQPAAQHLGCMRCGGNQEEPAAQQLEHCMRCGGSHDETPTQHLEHCMRCGGGDVQDDAPKSAEHCMRCGGSKDE